MDLTWKDKFSFYLTEFRQRLPFSDRPKRQLWIFGGSTGGIVVLFFVVFFITIKSPRLISSSFNVHLNQSPSNSGENDMHATNQQGANGQSLSPQPSGTPQSVGSKNSGNNQNVSPTSTTSQTQMGKSEVVLQSSPPPSITGSGGNSSESNGGSSSSPSNSNGSNNGSGGVIGTTDLSNVTLYFQSPSGTPEVYVTPTAPPADLTWQTYYNSRDNYSISYPVGWQAVKTVYNTHEGVGLYPPGADTSLTVQDGLQEIGFGVSQYNYQTPYFDSSNATYTTSVLVDGYSGTLYTQGSLGSNTIAVVFKYGDAYFGLGGTANSDEMIYVFNYMLSSLQLYGGSY